MHSWPWHYKHTSNELVAAAAAAANAVVCAWFSCVCRLQQTQQLWEPQFKSKPMLSCSLAFALPLFLITLSMYKTFPYIPIARVVYIYRNGLVLMCSSAVHILTMSTHTWILAHNIRKANSWRMAFFSRSYAIISKIEMQLVCNNNDCNGKHQQ